MRFFNRSTAMRKSRAGSHLALAIALASGATVGAVSFAEPAYAQKKKKKDKEPKAEYSKEFIAVYQPANNLVREEGGDPAAIKAAIPGVEAVTVSADEKLAAGSFIYAAGQKTADRALQFRGAELMLESGKVPAENLGQYNFIAAQLSYQIGNYANARKYGIAAIDAGYTANSPEVFVAETYLADDQAEQGLEYLGAAIQRLVDQGKPVDKTWIRRGLAIAFNSDLGPQAVQFGYWYASEHPSDESWGDAVAVVRNFNDLNSADELDILRLTRRSGTFRTRHEFNDYVEAADPRRLPGEVAEVIEEGYSSGLVSRDDLFIADSLALAKDRAASDRADLASLDSEAMAPGAPLNLVMGAGDAFLNYNQPAKAEKFYNKVLSMPGANTDVVLTRLGIAQFDQGRYDEAKSTFERVTGDRVKITRLWATYAGQKAASVAPAPADAAPAEVAAAEAA